MIQIICGMNRELTFFLLRQTRSVIESFISFINANSGIINKCLNETSDYDARLSAGYDSFQYIPKR